MRAPYDVWVINCGGVRVTVKTYRVGFLMFQGAGHITHDQHMRLETAKYPEIQAEWLPIHPWKKDRWQRLPVIRSNMTLLSGFRARAHLQCQTKPFDALYCHTPEAAVLLGKYMKQTPTILSLDATPANMDSIGPAYRHKRRSDTVEHVKKVLIKRSFERAAHLVTFSHWAKDSLIDDYGVSRHRITMNPPGLDLKRWNISKEERAISEADLTARVLFVGNGFQRKGGEVLLHSVASMQEKCAVDIVTNDPTILGPGGTSGVHIHRGLKAGTPELLALYRKANIFVLPTLGDCSPWVILEAMAMRLPVIATPVGGIRELVIHGETGLLIPPHSPEALIEAISELSRDQKRRHAMGIAARQRVEKYFDSAQNYRHLIVLIKSVADANK
jgi:glycosyltransferase involved in cell wall biosynthesis